MSLTSLIPGFKKNAVHVLCEWSLGSLRLCIWRTRLQTDTRSHSSNKIQVNQHKSILMNSVVQGLKLWKRRHFGRAFGACWVCHLLRCLGDVLVWCEAGHPVLVLGPLRRSSGCRLGSVTAYVLAGAPWYELQWSADGCHLCCAWRCPGETGCSSSRLRAA